MPVKITYSYYVDGVKLNERDNREDSVVEYIKMRKLDSEFVLEEMLRRFHKTNCPEQYPATDAQEGLRPIVELWDTFQEPFTMEELLKNYVDNTEHRMLVFRLAGPERLFNAMDSEVMDTETVTKKQTRTEIKEEFRHPTLNKLNLTAGQKPTEDMFETVEVEYEDTYTLHKIEGERVGINRNVYILECVCPSTDHRFFLFVDSGSEQCQTAIGAVSWTLRKGDNSPLSREEYLAIQSEA